MLSIEEIKRNVKDNSIYNVYILIVIPKVKNIEVSMLDKNKNT